MNERSKCQKLSINVGRDYFDRSSGKLKLSANLLRSVGQECINYSYNALAVASTCKCSLEMLEEMWTFVINNPRYSSNVTLHMVAFDILLSKFDADIRFLPSIPCEKAGFSINDSITRFGTACSKMRIFHSTIAKSRFEKVKYPLRIRFHGAFGLIVCASQSCLESEVIWMNLLRLSYIVSVCQSKWYPHKRQILLATGREHGEDPCTLNSTLASTSCLFTKIVINYVRQCLWCQASVATFYKDFDRAEPIFKFCLRLSNAAWTLIYKELVDIEKIHTRLRKKDNRVRSFGCEMSSAIMRCLPDLVKILFFLKCRLSDCQTLRTTPRHKDQYLYSPVAYLKILRGLQKQVDSTVPPNWNESSNDGLRYLRADMEKFMRILKESMWSNNQMFCFHPDQEEHSNKFRNNNAAYLMSLFEQRSTSQFITNFYKNIYCNNCLSRTKQLKHCRKCRNVSYCSRKCQKLHWKRSHKARCLQE